MIINKYNVFFTLSIMCSTTMAEFAVSNDPDGYINVRAEAKINAAIAFKINNGDVFYCLNDLKNGFYQIEINKYNFDNSSLYVHQSRAKFLSSFKAIQSIKKQGKEDPKSLRLVGSNYTIDLKVRPFNTKSHKLIYDEDSLLKSLDGFSKFWGSDQITPYSEYSLISVKYNNKVVNIPKDQIGDLFNPDLSNTQVFFDNKSQTLYLVAQNGDGAGVYHVVLVFKGGRYLSRLVVLDENV